MNRHQLILAGLAACLFSCRSKQPADLIVHNATIYTVDSAFSTVSALAIRDGKVLAVGSERDVLDAFGSDSVVDASGKTVFPGFIDAHAHFVGLGQSLFAVDLFNCASEGEMVERVRTFSDAHPGLKWIEGRGWDQNKFPGKGFPGNGELSRMFPDRPVVLERVDGHAVLANAKALELAGIRPGQQLTGGTVETQHGQLTGILIDNAVELLAPIQPALSAADMESRLRAAQEACFKQGLTTVTDCGLTRDKIELIDSLQKAKKLLMRLYVMVADRRAELEYYVPKGPYKTELLYVKGVKAYADGALGSRGACLIEPYNDRPGWAGFLLSNAPHFDSLANLLIGTDWQLCTHAIGDSANRVILQIYNKYLKGKNDKRWRMEHAQVINPADLALFGAASILPSVQPTHATSDMYWAGDRLGVERLKGGYAYKQLLAQNGWEPLGTDFPVEDVSPFKTYLAAVFRVDAKGYPAGGFQPENALTREEAIRGMTIWAAKADCLEKEVGSLEPGKAADFILLDRDLMKVAANEVLQTKVVATYARGKRVWQQ